MNDIQIGWVAGIMDGEGTISMDRRGIWRYPRISITSTDIEILVRIKETCGGFISPKKSTGLKHKNAWQWCISSSAMVIKMLTAIEPHLMCPKKKRRAAFILENWPKIYSRNGHMVKKKQDVRTKVQEDFFKL